MIGWKWTAWEDWATYKMWGFCIPEALNEEGWRKSWLNWEFEGSICRIYSRFIFYIISLWRISWKVQFVRQLQLCATTFKPHDVSVGQLLSSVLTLNVIFFSGTVSSQLCYGAPEYMQSSLSQPASCRGGMSFSYVLNFVSEKLWRTGEGQTPLSPKAPAHTHNNNNNNKAFSNCFFVLYLYCFETTASGELLLILHCPLMQINVWSPFCRLIL